MTYAQSMRVVTVRSYPQGPRVWVCGQRLHHGATGCALALVAVGGKRRLLGLVALALMAHDRADARVWFARECQPSDLDSGSTTR